MTISLLAFVGCALQDNFLYYPSPGVPSPKELAWHNLELWPPGKVDYRGFISSLPSSGADSRGTVVVFHGNAGTAADRVFYVEQLAPLGFRVLLAEYPGYGARPGKLGEASFVKDGVEVLKIVDELYGQPIFLLGESLGAGVAASLVAASPVKIEGLILITPWDSLRAVAKSLFPFLPVGFLLRDKYDSVENLKNFPGKIAVVAAERDEIIPLRHGENLYQSLRGEKKIWKIKGAGHNDWPFFVGGDWWREVMDFICRKEGT